MNEPIKFHSSALNSPVSERLKALLTRPLIVGASVSANHRGVASPARQLALRATSAHSIRTIAQNGRSASEILKLVSVSDLRDRTCIIGIDLLFWDSTRNRPDLSIQAFRSFVAEVMALNLPIAIGDVPGLFPPMQPSLKLLNDEVMRFKSEYLKCVVFPFNQIYRQILDDGELVHHGVHYSIKDLLPDGLHLSALAGQVLADRLQDEWLKQIDEADAS